MHTAYGTYTVMELSVWQLPSVHCILLSGWKGLTLKAVLPNPTFSNVPKICSESRPYIIVTFHWQIRHCLMTGIRLNPFMMHSFYPLALFITKTAFLKWQCFSMITYLFTTSHYRPKWPMYKDNNEYHRSRYLLAFNTIKISRVTVSQQKETMLILLQSSQHLKASILVA